MKLVQYWDGNNNNNCDWSTPDGGYDTDESCFKYDAGNGGYIPDPQLFNWLKNDLNNTNNDSIYYSWNIVIGHEPLYPDPNDNHYTSSLNQNTTNRDKLQQVFINYSVDAFMGAHTHTARMNITNGIYHANTGESGPNADKNYGSNGDNNASIYYATTYPDGTLEIIWVYENGNWNNATRQTWTKTWPR